MISEQEQVHIRLLSDNELYPQAVDFMKSIGRALPRTQINGLLNVSLANTYDQLKLFVERQCARTTWSYKEQHIPDFYKKLTQKLLSLETYALSLLKVRQVEASREDVQAIKMAITREFIQHILAENAYKDTMHTFTPTHDDDNRRNQARPYERGGRSR